MFVVILLGMIGSILEAGPLYWIMFTFACLVQMVKVFIYLAQ